MAVVQYTFTHKQYTERHSRHKQYTEQHSSLIRKSAKRAPSLRGIPWHLPYNWGKSTEKTLSQGSRRVPVAKESLYLAETLRLWVPFSQWMVPDNSCYAVHRVAVNGLVGRHAASVFTSVTNVRVIFMCKCQGVQQHPSWTPLQLKMMAWRAVCRSRHTWLLEFSVCPACSERCVVVRCCGCAEGP